MQIDIYLLNWLFETLQKSKTGEPKAIKNGVTHILKLCTNESICERHECPGDTVTELSIIENGLQKTEWYNNKFFIGSVLL